MQQRNHFEETGSAQETVRAQETVQGVGTVISCDLKSALQTEA